MLGRSPYGRGWGYIGKLIEICRVCGMRKHAEPPKIRDTGENVLFYTRGVVVWIINAKIH